MRVLNRIFYIFSFLVNIVFVFQIFADISGLHLDYYFSSDSLYLASIYKDLFVDHTGFEGWNLNLAPNFIPEWPVYFLISSLSDNFRISHILYAVYSVFIINLLTYGILSRVFNKIGISYLILANIGYSVFLLMYFTNGDFLCTSFLFLTGFHGGAFIMSLVAFLLFFCYLRSGKPVYLILLFLSDLSSIISDRLFFSLFVVPSITALVFVRDSGMRKPIIISVAIITIATLLGFLTFSLIKDSDYIYIVAMGYRSTDFENIIPSFSHYIDTLWQLTILGRAKSIIVILSALALIGGVFLSVKYIFSSKSTLAKNTIEKVLILSFTTQIVFVAITPILNGTFLGLAHLRYNFYSFYIAITLLMVILYLLTRNHHKIKSVINIVSIAIVLLLILSIVKNENKNNTIRGLDNTFSYYPEKVAVLDSIASEHNLKYGVGNYWDAKYITMFSKNNVRIYCVYKNLCPWYHVTNKHWYFKDGKGKYGNPEFRFILLSDLDLKESYLAIFEGNIDTIAVKDISIAIVPEFGFTKSRKLFLIPKEE